MNISYTYRYWTGLLVSAMLMGCATAPTATVPTQPSGLVNGGLRVNTRTATKNDLLYVAESSGYVDTFTYPGGAFVNRFGSNASGGLCSDKYGNVFVTDFKDEAVFKYAHGGTTPIATLRPNAQPLDCSVDPASGNLATVNLDYNDTTSVSIFRNASGSPVKYTDPNAELGPTCSYDDQGNLLVSAATTTQSFLIAELPTGSASFQDVKVNGTFRGGNFMQWDGQHAAVANAQQGKPVMILRVNISGSVGTIIGKTKLKGSKAYLKYFWLQSGTLITPQSGGGTGARKIGLWPYPTGGKPTQIIKLPKAGQSTSGVALGITVSVK